MTPSAFHLVNQSTLSTSQNYQASLQKIPGEIEAIKGNLDLLPTRDFHQFMQPALVFLVPLIQNRSRHWPINLDQLNRQHHELILFISDIALLSSQLSSATQRMNRTQRASPLEHLDFGKPPFSLRGRFTALRLSDSLQMLEQIRQRIHSSWTVYSGAVFYASIVADSVPLIYPRLIDFMDAATSSFASRYNLKRVAPYGRNYLLTVAMNDLAAMRQHYIDVSLASSNLHAYFSHLSTLLYTPTQVISTVYRNSSIRNLDDALKMIVISLNEIRYLLQAR
jgi:hypothetical protein